jgi:hypothetical protein
MNGAEYEMLARIDTPEIVRITPGIRKETHRSNTNNICTTLPINNHAEVTTRSKVNKSQPLASGDILHGLFSIDK